MATVDSYIPVTQAKSQLLDLVRQIHDHDRSIAITKNGVPEVVLLSMARFEGLLETVEIMADENQMRDIRKSIDEVNNGRWVEMVVDESSNNREAG